MKEIRHKVKDREGIHARPAGELVKLATELSSDISIEKDGKTGDAKRIFAVMALGAKCNDEIIIKINGQDENEAYERITEFLKSNL